MKTYGIIADNYKVNRFKKELRKKGLNSFTVEPYKTGLSVIKISTEKDEVKKVNQVCTIVEFHFRRSN